jgi:hypothetical protein
MAYDDELVAAATSGTPTNPQGVPLQLAALMLAQAKHETGNFTSGAFLQGKNAFGYSYVNGAVWQLPYPNPVSEGSRLQAAYASLSDSTKEIVDWLYRRQAEGTFPDLTTVTTTDQYANLLKSTGYYAAPVTTYLEGLKRWYQSLTPAQAATVAAGAGGGLFLLFILLLLLTTKQKKTANA